MKLNIITNNANIIEQVCYLLKQYPIVNYINADKEYIYLQDNDTSICYYYYYDKYLLNFINDTIIITEFNKILGKLVLLS